MSTLHERGRGRVALVTGAGGRIGRAICLDLASTGVSVVASDIDRSSLGTTMRELGPGHRHLVADLANTSTLRPLVDEAAAIHGRLDVLVNNAAVLEPGGTVLDCPEEVLARTLAVNVTAPFLLTKAAIPHMLAVGGGSIVNIASVLGVVGRPGFSSYAVSKGAIVQLTRQVAVDHAAAGIRCNAVCPGTVVDETVTDSTAFRASHPVGRTGQASEVAAVVTFLASDRASFMHGAIVAVDGGWTAW